MHNIIEICHFGVRKPGFVAMACPHNAYDASVKLERAIRHVFLPFQFVVPLFLHLCNRSFLCTTALVWVASQAYLSSTDSAFYRWRDAILVATVEGRS